MMGFRVESRSDEPVPSAVLERDGIRMRLAENGGDPSQDGCAFEVDNVEQLLAEFKANGLTPREGYEVKATGSISDEIGTETHDDGSEWRVFFVVAPDGLCYWFGQRSEDTPVLANA
jgi:hypothetical protein